MFTKNRRYECSLNVFRRKFVNTKYSGFTVCLKGQKVNVTLLKLEYLKKLKANIFRPPQKLFLFEWYKTIYKV